MTRAALFCRPSAFSLRADVAFSPAPTTALDRSTHIKPGGTGCEVCQAAQILVLWCLSCGGSVPIQVSSLSQP